MRIGLFFGSFNPIHNGHMSIAQNMLNHTHIDQVWFVVSPQNPLKKQSELATDYQRLKMVQLAVKGFYPEMQACDIEMGMPRPSYTIDTIKLLKQTYPRNSFSIILGSDSLETITQWKQYQDLLYENEIHIYPRKGSDLNMLTRNYPVNIIPSPEVDISSTYVRKQISEGKDISNLVPNEVAQFLANNKVY